MKSFTGLCLYATIISVMCFTACSKSAVAPPAATAATDSISTLLTTGSWMLSAVTQKKEDNTADFAGYVFTFSSGGVLSAVKNGVAVQGTWHFSPAVTYYGSSSKDALAISIGTNNPFRHLTKTWNLASISASGITLDNPEVLEDEHLQFQKK